MSEVERLPQLDGLRGIAILMVFLNHALDVPLFWCGVDLFFVLSGYLITGVLLRLKERDAAEGIGIFLRHFYSRRIRRIFPPYFLFLLVVSILYAVRWSQVWFWYVFFAANIANLLHVTPASPLLPLWSLAVEEQFYLVWPFVVFLTSLCTLKRVAAGVMVAGAVLRACFTPLLSSSLDIYVLALFRADSLACGAFIAIAAHENAGWIESKGLRAGRWAAATGAAFCLLSALASFRSTAYAILFNGLGYPLVALTFGGALIYIVGRREGLVHTILTIRILRHVGLISFTFYLYHYGVLFLLRQHIQGMVYVSLLGLAITGTISAISWWCLEAPILGLPGILPKRTVGLQAPLES